MTLIAIDDARSAFAMVHAGCDLETELMVGRLRQNSPMLSVASFRAWLGSRPDEEHWELIEGIPVLMAPRERRHQRIASNLEDLLNDVLKRHNP
ncbi:MAG: Uma2 family endonuclease, partial [Xanthobacteraceae bacterium]|nr:Uma2 family endonuclease [Xanthobacteraceae bacterium]